MAKEKVVRQMTDEQRQRIMKMPGVVVHRRDPRAKREFFQPRIAVRERVQITAGELIDAEDDEECNE